jgi:hypothetical protein
MVTDLRQRPSSAESHHPDSQGRGGGLAQRRAPPHPTQTPARNHEHASRPFHAAPVERPGATTGCCRARTLSVRGARQCRGLQRLGRVQKGLANVVLLQVRIEIEDLLARESIADHPNHRRDGNAQSADAGNTTHLVGPDGDSRKLHTGKLAQETDPSGGALGAGGARGTNRRDGTLSPELAAVKATAAPSGLPRARNIVFGMGAPVGPTSRPRLRRVRTTAPLKPSSGQSPFDGESTNPSGRPPLTVSKPPSNSSSSYS